MRRFVTLCLVCLLTLMAMRPESAQAEVPAKARAFLTILGYGTAGGAILGAATMAFGTTSQAVFQGASLGLYAGIVFGSFVLISHHNKRTGNYEDNTSPYGESTDVYGEGYEPGEGGSSEGEEPKGFFNRIQTMQQKFSDSKQKGGQMPPLYLNLIQYNF